MKPITSFSPETIAKLERFADGMVVLIVLCLPWSTSATAICTAVWLAAVIPTLRLDALGHQIAQPAAWLPVALFALAALGMLWAQVPFSEAADGLDSFLKFLVIPLLLLQFRRSDRGMQVLTGFLASCTLLLLASGLSALSPNGDLWGLGKSYGVPVKDYISQSAMFTICAFALLYLSISELRAGRQVRALSFAAFAVLFFGDMFFIVSSRTALITIPILLVCLIFRDRGWRNMSGVGLAVVALVGVALVSSEHVRMRLGNLAIELHSYQTLNIRTSAGERYDFWKRSLAILEEAPVLGHGTGTIRAAFTRSATGQTGVSALVSDNPHNQTLAVAIQLGLVGVFLLYAMWCAHLLLFRGSGLVAWVGVVVVMQNFVGSLFNSHLFDSTHGWLYVIGVGVAGGMMLKKATVPKAEMLRPAQS